MTYENNEVEFYYSTGMRITSEYIEWHVSFYNLDGKPAFGSLGKVDSKEEAEKKIQREIRAERRYYKIKKKSWQR